ncbi:MAG: hypothetical protein ACE5R7_09030 [Nitrosarchaeum sp.]
MKLIFFSIFSIILLSNFAFAETDPILISKSVGMNDVIFDGKWTFTTEWKPSSWNQLNYDNEKTIHLRTAHQDEFLYVFVDFVSDITLDKNSDNAIICFDTKNDKTEIADSNDYCFSVSLDSKSSFTYQGGSPFAMKGNFKKIPNPESMIAISSVSGDKDRYSIIPHTNYEFKIPIELLGRSNVYGFYLGVYDHHERKIYSWPQDITQETLFDIPSPKLWGEIRSPDNSLPEFGTPIIVFSVIITMILILFKTNNRFFILKI